MTVGDAISCISSGIARLRDRRPVFTKVVHQRRVARGVWCSIVRGTHIVRRETKVIPRRALGVVVITCPIELDQLNRLLHNAYLGGIFHSLLDVGISNNRGAQPE